MSLNLLSLYPALSILVLFFYLAKQIRTGRILALCFAVISLVLFPSELIFFGCLYALFYFSLTGFPMLLERKNLKAAEKFLRRREELQEENQELQKVVQQLSDRVKQLSLEIEKILERYNFARALVSQTEEEPIFLSLTKIFEKEKSLLGIAFFALPQEVSRPELKMNELSDPHFSQGSFKELMERNFFGGIQISLKSISQQEVVLKMSHAMPPSPCKGEGGDEDFSSEKSQSSPWPSPFQREGKIFLVSVPINWARKVRGILALLLSRPAQDRFLEEISKTAQFLGLGFQKAELYRTMIEHSRKDGLTQLYLRRIFLERLNQEITLSKRYGTSFSILMMDLDHFKSVNDTYGHLAGDAVLKAFAASLRENLHPGVMICRYGGEEFAVLIGLAPRQEVLQIAETVRKAIENKKIEISEEQKIQVTVSIGVAHYLPDAPLPDELIQRADIALYRAKESGRNCVREWK